MNNYLPICIKANLITLSGIFNTNLNIINKYLINLNIEQQYIYNTNTIINSTNIKSNMWFSNNQSGNAWKITNINSVSGNSINCIIA